MQTITKENDMNSRYSNVWFAVFAFILGLICVMPYNAAAQSDSAGTATPSKPAATAPSKPAAAPPPGARAFDTPEAAADALIKATSTYDTTELNAILGPEGEEIVTGGDQVQDKKNAIDFAEKAAKKKTVEIDPSNPNRATVVVGEEDWPTPIPIVERNGKWYFDAKAGKREVLYRRIGTNELDAITVCRGYVDAQFEYSLTPHNGINQYAQRIISTPGKQDGLYWKNEDGTSGGPIGEEVAKAIEEGYNYSTVKQGGFHGYYFKILKGQGPAAPIGKINYVIEGVMIGGFALVAVPAEYRVTGVKTFIVSNDGIVYEKDLGPNSLEIAKKMELYNPDKTWKPTDDGWPGEPAVAEQ
jgi:hypothetical protein